MINRYVLYKIKRKPTEITKPKKNTPKNFLEAVHSLQRSSAEIIWFSKQSSELAKSGIWLMINVDKCLQVYCISPTYIKYSASFPWSRLTTNLLTNDSELAISTFSFNYWFFNPLQYVRPFYSIDLHFDKSNRHFSVLIFSKHSSSTSCMLPHLSSENFLFSWLPGHYVLLDFLQNY